MEEGLAYLLRRLEKIPSLKVVLNDHECWDDLWGDARLLAGKETEMAMEVFPEICPYQFRFGFASLAGERLALSSAPALGTMRWFQKDYGLALRDRSLVTAGPTACRAPGLGRFAPDFCSHKEHNMVEYSGFVLSGRTVNSLFRPMPGTTVNESLFLLDPSLIGKFWTGAHVRLTTRMTAMYPEALSSLF